KMDELRVQEALDIAFDIFRRANKYIDETEPWVLAKDAQNKDKLDKVMYNLSCMIVVGASLIKAFMPSTSEKILSMFNVELVDIKDYKDFSVIKDGTKVTDTKENLFVRKDIKDIDF
ncbi:MAG: methionine--tRNA ligase, partial [Lachnospiraceae bacterium]|nr:methionine--tRNA ligase [Lachnospiraceae bacterium]